MAADLQLRLLGGLTLTHPTAPLTRFISNKAPALLAYLAVTRRPQPREALAGLLWGELPDADAKNNLRQTLSNLRRLLDPYLLIDRDTVALNPTAALFLDVAAFEAGLAAAAGDLAPEARAARLGEAAALYHGDFLAGLAVRDAPEFEDWMLAQRARFRELALHAFHTLTQLHLQRGDTAEAIDSATRLLGLEAWREEAHRQLMLALARGGQRSAALAQYETCRRLLAKELGVEPSAETTALYDRICAAKRRVHLPPAATPFVGRADELAQIARLLADPTGRLITLSGPGGGGKTRLALEAAARAAPRFLHGVCFVALAAAGSLEVAPSAVAEALGVTLSGKVDPREQLLAHLRDKELLLVLDNLEHLAGADEWVGQLAQAGPEVRLLVTTRERLNLHGERLLEVSGLESPPDTGAAIGGYSAAQLFVNSAQASQPSFALTAESAAAVGRICRLVHGLPLAIELAAAWVRQLPCHEIAEAIEHNLSFLATTQKNVPARHRSLEAAFEHSWALLAAGERSAFARLTVLRGGGEREAAVAVGQCSPAVLAALVDKSLVQRAPSGRFTIHELLRQYAERKLQAEPPAYAAAQAQHAAYYLSLVGELEDALNDARQANARQTMTTEADNWRTAWAWAVAQPKRDRLEPALESLRIFLDRVGWYAEGVRLFGSAAEAEWAGAGEASLLYAQLAARQAWFYHRLDRFEAARPLVAHSLALFDAARPPRPAEAALCEQCLGNMARAVGDFKQAVAHGRQGVALLRAASNPRALAAALNTLGAAYTEQGDLDAARQTHAESLALKRAVGDRNGAAVSLVNLGNVALAQGDYATAKPLEREALDIFRETGYPMGEAVALNNLGACCYMLGELAEAEPVLEACLTICRELGHRYIAAYALANLAGVAGKRGDYPTAWQHARAALQTAAAVNSISATVLVLVRAAGVLAQQGQAERAAEVAALVGHHPAANHETKGQATQLLAQLERQLPAPQLAAAQERGRARMLAVVAAEVLAWAEAQVGVPKG